jgi:site-specific DNA recombinase
MVTDRVSVAKTRVRCAIYTRKSSEDGLEQDFNSLDAQREACEAFVRSQHGEGWFVLAVHFDDAGYSGGTLDRPALQTLLHEIRAGNLDVVVVYKIDRLTRSLLDFCKMVEIFERHNVSFVSVTQRFNTTASLGRLTLNILLSFAQFEREVTADRIRDKIAASKKKGMWMGGHVPLGDEAKGRTLVINEAEAETVRTTFRLYLELGAVRVVAAKARQLGFRTKRRQDGSKAHRGNRYLSRGYIYKLLSNPIYAGIISYRGTDFPALHPAIIDKNTWDAVQNNLASNSKKHRIRSDAKQPSLLAGFIFDETGDRLIPAHCTKRGEKRYRYYVSNRLIKKGKNRSTGGLRVPAVQLEGIVARALINLSCDAPLLAEIPGAGGIPTL